MQPKKWHFVLATWNPQNGIMIFVDGPLLALEPTSTKITPKLDDKLMDQHHITIGIKILHWDRKFLNQGTNRINSALCILFQQKFISS